MQEEQPDSHRDEQLNMGVGVKIMAEIASAHEGDMKKLLQMVDVANSSGCDFVKFQMFRAKEIVAKDHPKYDNYHVKEYSEEEWISISDYCVKEGIGIITEIFDYDSLLIAQKMEVSGYKLHSTTVSDVQLLVEVAKDSAPIYLSAGGSTKEEMHKAINTISSNYFYIVIT